MKKLPIALLLMIIGAASAGAQHRWFPPSELFSYGVKGVAKDESGSLWALVSNPSKPVEEYAVQKYDGMTWDTISAPEFAYPLTAQNTLWDISVNGNDVIIGAENYVLQFDRMAQRWHAIEYDDSLKGERSFRHVFTDSKGYVWITAEARSVLRRDTVNGVPMRLVVPYNEVFRLNGGHLEKLFHLANPRSGFTNPVEDSKNNIWIACQVIDTAAIGGLFKYDGTSFTIVTTPPGSNASRGPRAVALQIDPDDNIYILSNPRSGISGTFYPATVTRIAQNMSTYTDVQLPRSIEFVTTLATYNGHTYLGATGGLYDITSGVARNLDFTTYFPGFTSVDYLRKVNDIKISGNTMYCATGWGIVIFDPVSALSSVENLSADRGSSIISPNPVRGGEIVTINPILAEGERIAKAEVVNSLGQNIPVDVIIESGMQGTLRVPTDNLTSGAYFVRIRTTGDWQPMTVHLVVER